MCLVTIASQSRVLSEDLVESESVHELKTTLRTNALTTLIHFCSYLSGADIGIDASLS